MIKPINELTVTCIDNGLFTDFCAHIAPAFKQTYYWTPWTSSFPKSNHILPGKGIDELTRVKWLHDAIENSDLVFCPDVYYGDLQESLVRQGKLVWGARKGELIELDRMQAKKILEKHGVQPSPADVVYGMDALRDYLKEHDDVWVKTSTVRGDFETFKNKNYELSMPKLDELEHKLGARKQDYEFIIEPDINPAVEWGIDAFTIDGQWPVRTYSGWEIKDLGFVGRVMEWKEIPQYLRQPNEAMSPWFKEQQYRGFFSTELRILKNRETYLIDPCARLPSPPNEVQQMVFSNWAEIIYAGAQGKMIEPKIAHKYGVCAMIHSSWADKNWQSIQFPEEIRQWVKLRNHCRIDGTDYCVPCEVGLPEVGAVVGVGDTLDEAIAHLEDNAEKVEGYYVEIKLDSIQTAMEEVKKGEELGLEL